MFENLMKMAGIKPDQIEALKKSGLAILKQINLIDLQTKNLDAKLLNIETKIEDVIEELKQLKKLKGGK